MPPDGVEPFLAACEEAGFRRLDSFESGSVFGHATTLAHEEWGLLDVHREVPGIGLSPATAFAVWTRGARWVPIAERWCLVPSLPAQVLVLLLHAARAGTSLRARADVEAAWHAADPALRREVRELVTELRADLPFALAVGEDVERFRDRPDFGLWVGVSRGASRTEEWRNRVRSAEGVRRKATLLARAVLPNTDSMAMRFGRPPTRPEVAREAGRRAGRAVTEIATRRRRTGSPD